MLKKTYLKRLVALSALILVTSLSLSACAATEFIRGFIDGFNEANDFDDDDEDDEGDDEGKVGAVENDDLTRLRENLISNDDFVGIAYIPGTPSSSIDDFIESHNTTMIFDKYSFIDEIPEDHYVDANGEDIFVVVPASKDDTVIIYSASFHEDEDEILADEKIYEGDGGPIVLRANESDIMGNTVIEISPKDGGHFTFIPTLSLKNSEHVEVPFGSIHGKYVYDFSVYSDGTGNIHLKTLHKYDDIISDFFMLIYNDGESDDDIEGSTGVRDLTRAVGYQQALQEVGFYVGYIGEMYSPVLMIKSTEGDNLIYALFTLDDNGNPELIFESNGRQAYYHTGESFIYRGSDSAMTSISANMGFHDDGSIYYEGFYFTYDTDMDGEIEVYRNSTGEIDPEGSERMDMTMEEFEKLYSDYVPAYETVDATNFIELDGEGYELFFGN